METNCTQIRIAPQALPYPSVKNGNYTYGAYSEPSASGTEVYVDSGTHRVYRRTENNGMYNSAMGCTSGIPGLDNNCICPGSMNSRPYEIQPPALTAAANQLLFAPFIHHDINPLGPAAQRLVAERSPLCNGASYDFDTHVGIRH